MDDIKKQPQNFPDTPPVGPFTEPVPINSAPKTTAEPKSEPGPKPEPEPVSKPEPETPEPETITTTPETPKTPTPVITPPEPKGTTYQSLRRTCTGIGLCLTILLLISLGFGIFSIIRLNQLTEDLNRANDKISTLETAQNAGLLVGDDYLDLLDGEDTTGDGSEPTSCTLPKRADNISYLYVLQNGGTQQFIVDPAAHEVTYYTGNDSDYNEKTIVADTKDLTEYLFSNALGDFSNENSFLSDFSDDEIENSNTSNFWYVSIDGDDDTASSCVAGGLDNPPAWFNTLVDMINSKKATE